MIFHIYKYESQFDVIGHCRPSQHLNC